MRLFAGVRSQFGKQPPKYLQAGGNPPPATRKSERKTRRRHIFTSGEFNVIEIVRPPLPKHPSDTLKALWTDGSFWSGATVGG